MEPLIALAIKLPPRGSRSILAALHLQFRAAIIDGRLKPGLRLPSTRVLATTYSVSRNTAVAAYDLLLSEGYVTVRRGSGTVVAESLPHHKRSRPSSRADAERRLNPYWRGRDLKAQRDPKDPPRIAFHVGAPDLVSFPYAVWHRLSGRVARQLRAGLRLDTTPQGYLALREAIARHVSFARAVSCGPEDIVVTTGAQQAFDLLARVFATPAGTTVAIENPGYPPLREAFAALGARIVPVPIDDEGLVVARLPERPGVICVTPSHQFPLGSVMSARRRADLLDFSQQRGCIVIEDDYDGEFRFVDRPLDALQTLDRSQSVFYVGTFSKCLLPDLRLGYIVAPAWARSALVAAKAVSDGWSSFQAQATLSLFIKEGHLSRHVRKMRRVYGRRRHLILESLSSAFGRWFTPLPSVAGLHVTAKITGSWSETAFINRAREAGVGIGALRPFMRGVMFGYGFIEEVAILEGMRRLRISMPSH
jgi:GntR family transcriptional regulator/MocR family aminotransferase